MGLHAVKVGLLEPGEDKDGPPKAEVLLAEDFTAPDIEGRPYRHGQQPGPV